MPLVVQSPFAVCAAAIPAWCVAVPARFPFLLPLATRVHMFRLTAFGVDWAVKYNEGTSRVGVAAGLRCG